MQSFRTIVQSENLLGAILLVALMATNSSAIEAEWIGGPTGNWSVPANWSTGVVPNGSQANASIDSNPGQNSEVMLDQLSFSGDLSIDEGDSLDIANGELTSISVFLAGNLSLSDSATLKLNNLLWVQPTGTLSLGSEPPQGSSTINSSIPISLNPKLWNEGSIEGAGSIRNLNFNNQGTISANVNGQKLTLEITPSNAASFNSGSLIAENGGQLLLVPGLFPFFNSLVNQSGTTGGLIEARGDSMITLQEFTLVGGQIATTSEGGTLEGTVQLQQMRLDGVRLEGQIEATSFSLLNTIENNSTIQGAKEVNVLGDTSLNGSGTLQLDYGHILGPSSAGTPLLVNETGHTIAGVGALHLDDFYFVNHGLLEAREGTAGQALTLTVVSGPLPVNSGVIRAADSSTLRLIGAGGNSPTLKNFEGSQSGVIEAGVNSTILLQGMTIDGGILRSVAPPEGSSDQAGSFVDSYGNLLKNVRIEGSFGHGYWGFGGTIENTGTLNGSVLIQLDTTLTGGGRLQFGSSNGPGGLAVSSPSVGWVQLINEDNVISGIGGMTLKNISFINRGTIHAETPASEFRIDPQLTGGAGVFPMVNSGVMQATQGAFLNIQAKVINHEGSTLGTIHAADNSQVQITTVEGGILSTAGSGEIFFPESSFPTGSLIDVWNEGKLRMSSGATISGFLLNDGTIINDTNTDVRFTDPVVQLKGSGEWISTKSFNFVSGPTSTTVLVQDADHTIRGFGRLTISHGVFVNHGTIEAQNGPFTIELEQGTTMLQQGTLQTTAQYGMEVQTRKQRFENEGTIDTEGSFNIVRMDSGPLEFLNTNGAEIHVGEIFRMASQHSLGSLITLWNQAGALLAGSGEINLLDSYSPTSGVLRNSGVIRPEGDHNSTGQLLIQGEFEQDATGSLELELGGDPASGMFDSLTFGENSMSLAGALDITLVEGFSPSVGDSFEIIATQGGSVTGAFDTFSVPALAGGWWQLEYLTDKVLLNVAAITADFDNSGFVDGKDLAEWQAAYGVNALADADGDGDSDGQDFLAWQRQFGSGVPPGGAQAVPEPASGWLLAFFTVGLFVCRRK